MDKVQLEEIIEASDVLVVVHPDFPNGSKPELMLLQQEIGTRTRQYLKQGKKCIFFLHKKVLQRIAEAICFRFLGLALEATMKIKG
ncbi:TPA: hypothetical protein HA246_00115 [Candidatus Woesearchaeota archaeon]|nr:hypothetical protein [Candidatus Woesearchaeota archaeon]